MLLPILTKARQATSLTQSFNSLKMKDEVFSAKLQKQTKFDVSIETSQILFGNRNADLLITIVTNPLCGPCAKLHAGIDEILGKYGKQLCVQYIFAHFKGEDKQQGVQRLIAIYQEHNMEESQRIYKEWYSATLSESQFIEKYKCAIESKKVITEKQKHDDFTERNHINATPTIMINGYLLPIEYTIEDVMTFIE